MGTLNRLTQKGLTKVVSLNNLKNIIFFSIAAFVVNYIVYHFESIGTVIGWIAIVFYSSFALEVFVPFFLTISSLFTTEGRREKLIQLLILAATGTLYIFFVLYIYTTMNRRDLFNNKANTTISVNRNVDTIDYDASFEKFRLAMYILTIENNLKLTNKQVKLYDQQIVNELNQWKKKAEKTKDKNTAIQIVEEIISVLKRLGLDDHRIDINEAIIIDRWNNLKKGLYKTD